MEQKEGSKRNVFRCTFKTIEGEHCFCFSVIGQPGDLLASNCCARDTSRGPMSVADLSPARSLLPCSTFSMARRPRRLSTTHTQYTLSSVVDDNSNNTACTTVATLGTALMMLGLVLSDTAGLEALVREGVYWHPRWRSLCRGQGTSSLLSALDIYDLVAVFRDRFLHHDHSQVPSALGADADASSAALVHSSRDLGSDGTEPEEDDRVEGQGGGAQQHSQPTRQGVIGDGFSLLHDILAWGSARFGHSFGAAGEAPHSPTPQQERERSGCGYSVLVTTQCETVGVFVPWDGPACLLDSHGLDFGDGAPSGAYLVWFQSPHQLQEFLRQRFKQGSFSTGQLSETVYEMNAFTLAPPRDPPLEPLRVVLDRLRAKFDAKARGESGDSDDELESVMGDGRTNTAGPVPRRPLPATGAPSRDGPPPLGPRPSRSGAAASCSELDPPADDAPRCHLRSPSLHEAAGADPGGGGPRSPRGRVSLPGQGLEAGPPLLLPAPPGTDEDADEDAELQRALLLSLADAPGAAPPSPPPGGPGPGWPAAAPAPPRTESLEGENGSSHGDAGARDFLEDPGDLGAWGGLGYTEVLTVNGELDEEAAMARALEMSRGELAAAPSRDPGGPAGASGSGGPRGGEARPGRTGEGGEEGDSVIRDFLATLPAPVPRPGARFAPEAGAASGSGWGGGSRAAWGRQGPPGGPAGGDPRSPAAAGDNQISESIARINRMLAQLDRADAERAVLGRAGAARPRTAGGTAGHPAWPNDDRDRRWGGPRGAPGGGRGY